MTIVPSENRYTINPNKILIRSCTGNGDGGGLMEFYIEQTRTHKVNFVEQSTEVESRIVLLDAGKKYQQHLNVTQFLIG